MADSQAFVVPERKMFIDGTTEAELQSLLVEPKAEK